MSSKKDHESMENLDKCLSIVQQSSIKGGISAKNIGEKLGMHRTTVHRHLTSLELMGKVESQHGLWTTKKGEQTVAPLEKEIVIELPTPEKEWQRVAMLKTLAHDANEHSYRKTANIYSTMLESYKETRTIRIKGKNVTDLDMEKLGALIEQANEKSAKINIGKFFRNLKRPQPKEKSPDH
jgi:DNA-binding MarR family transcriptional regulator